MPDIRPESILQPSPSNNFGEKRPTWDILDDRTISDNQNCQDIRYSGSRRILTVDPQPDRQNPKEFLLTLDQQVKYSLPPNHGFEDAALRSTLLQSKVHHGLGFRVLAVGFRV